MSDPGEVSQAPARSRVFFALWPEADVRAKMHRETRRLHRQLGGKPTHPDTLHLTLVFIGEVEDGRLKDLAEAAAAVKCTGFTMAFDRLDCWRHNRIAHVGIAQPPRGLFDLVRQLSSRLNAISIPFDVRPYKPHVTLLRKADCTRLSYPDHGNLNENPALEPICWSARDFVLVKASLRPEGARYEQLGRWPLL
jgi:RNA 2',3'-cyclic 3'-phosphodiesterase